MAVMHIRARSKGTRIGAAVVLRGTIHAWRNPSPDTPARMALVLIDAKPDAVAGASLPEIMPGPVHSKE